MSGTPAAPADVAGIIARSPFLSWLGLEVVDTAKGSIEVKARWREEWVANPVLGQTQGGILAALVDFAANLALFEDLGRAVLTIDLRVDYHRIASRGSDLVAKGKVVKLGRQVSVCEASVFDAEGRLVASGRGTFLTAPQSKD